MSQKRQPDEGKGGADDGDDRGEKRQRGTDEIYHNTGNTTICYANHAVCCQQYEHVHGRKNPVYLVHKAPTDVGSGVCKMYAILPPFMGEVKEEVELALATHLGCKKRHCGKQVHPSTSRSLQLHFTNKLSLPIFTGSKIEGEDCSVINVAVVDTLTGETVTSGQESSIKVEIVVLEGDFEGGKDGNWTSEDFNNNIVRAREGKRPLLTGDVLLNLNEGISMVGEIMFTDNSSWTRSRKFRLGARAVDGNVDGVRVVEAKTEAFMVKDHRGELYKKHYPPSMCDEVWRLEKIGKDGAFHKRLNSENIHTVKDFLRLLWVDSQKLRNILGTGMSAKMWEVTAEHARTCTPDRQLHIYCPDGQTTMGVVFNSVGQITGLLTEQFIPVNELSESQKFGDFILSNNAEAVNWPGWEIWMSQLPFYVLVLDIALVAGLRLTFAGRLEANAHNMVKAAFDHWDEVIPYDDVASSMSRAPTASSFLPDSVAAENPHAVLSSCQHQRSGGYGFIPSVSSPDMVSSMLSIGGAKQFDYYTQQAIDCLGFRSVPEAPPGFAGQDFCKDSRVSFCRVANSLLDVESMSPSFCTEDHFQYFDADSATTSQQPQSLHGDSRPQAELGNTRTALLRKAARPGHSDGKAHSTWMMLIRVLKWKFSIRRIVASKKKCRLWESDEFG
ncbi:hypothetical protein ACLOJK_030939 [Asimina triloba]